MREAPPSAVKNKKRATRGSPQGVTRRSKRHAATPQGPVDSAARRDNQQSNGGQDLAGGISPPAHVPEREKQPLDLRGRAICAFQRSSGDAVCNFMYGYACV